MESNTKGRETKNMKLQAQIISISGNEATVMNESFPVFKLPLSLLEGHKLGDIITIEIANNTLDRPHLLEGSKTAESVEEAAVRRFNERLGTENDGAYYIGFKDGADWQAFRSQPESNGCKHEALQSIQSVDGRNFEYCPICNYSKETKMYPLTPDECFKIKKP